MSVAITLQEDLVVTINPAGFQLSIPSGTVLTFLDAVATGPFNQALDAAADQLANISMESFVDNLSEFERDVQVGTNLYAVTYGPLSQAVYTPYSHSHSASSSSSASPSSSASHSASHSASASPSSSASPS